MRWIRFGSVAGALAVAIVLAVGAVSAPAAKAPLCKVTNTSNPAYSYDSLQAALDDSVPYWGDTFIVNGTCTGVTVIDEGVTSTEPLTIVGQEAKGYTAPTLNGGGAGPVVSIYGSGTTVEIKSLAITGGLLTGSLVGGGGIFNQLGTLTVSGSTISGNEAQIGGGIANGGTLTVENSAIRGNTAGMGGGIANVSGTVTITRTTISGNTASISASGGGGIFTLGGSVEFNDSTVSDNTTAGMGGGIVAVGDSGDPAALTLNGKSKVNANSAAAGAGGVLLIGSTEGTAALTLNDSSRITNNTVDGTNSDWGPLSGLGGGVLLYDATASLTLNGSSYISGNTAAVAGGGIAYNTLATLTNCNDGSNVYRNTPDNIYSFTTG